MPNRIPYHGARPALASADLRESKRERDAFYSSARWRDLPKRHLAKFPLCAACLRKGDTTAANVVHHVQDRLQFPALAFAPSNLESACNSCHTTHHKTKSGHRNP